MNNDIPGWGDLIVNTHQPSSFKEAERHALAANNVHDAILPGLGALGVILWQAEQLEDGVEKQDVAKIGLMMQSLAELLQGLNLISVNSSIYAANLAAGLDQYGQTAKQEAA